MNKAIGTETLLTSDDIRQWQEELAEAEHHAAELRKKLEGVALIFGSKFSLSDLPKSKDEPENESMGDAVKRILATFRRPISHHELQDELRKIPRFRETLEKNNGAYYYTVINRLKKRDPPEIRKTGKKIRLVHKNETPPEGNPEGASKTTVEG